MREAIGQAIASVVASATRKAEMMERRTNVHAGPCAVCSMTVNANSGYLLPRNGRGGHWLVVHPRCTMTSAMCQGCMQQRPVDQMADGYCVDCRA